jgi:hypothetical protein
VVEDDNVDGVVADGQVDEQRAEVGVAAGADAEGGAGDVHAGAEAARQREPQLHQVVGVELHRPPGSLVHAPVRLAADVPDLPSHLALRQRTPPRMRQLCPLHCMSQLVVRHPTMEKEKEASDPTVRTYLVGGIKNAWAGHADGHVLDVPLHHGAAVVAGGGDGPAPPQVPAVGAEVPPRAAADDEGGPPGDGLPQHPGQRRGAAEPVLRRDHAVRGPRAGLRAGGQEVPAVGAAEEHAGPAVGPRRVVHRPHRVVHAALPRQAHAGAVGAGSQVLAAPRAAPQAHEPHPVEHFHGGRGDRSRLLPRSGGRPTVS